MFINCFVKNTAANESEVSVVNADKKALYVPNYDFGNIEVELEYSKEFDETFISPSYPEGSKFDVASVAYSDFLEELTRRGFEVVGGHEYSIQVVGNPCKV